MIAQLQQLVILAWHFVLISFFAVGGGVIMLVPQMHAEFVQQFHWLSDRSFLELLAVSQAAPGPNFLLVPLIGFRIAGWPGAIVSISGFLFFPILISLFVGRLLHQHQNEWILRFRRGFRPVTGGLFIASGLVVSAALDHGPVPIVITAAVAIISVVIDISPIWWCLIAGIAGYALA